MTVLEKFLNGDLSALARIISYIENREENYEKLLAKLYPKSGHTVKIGFTGPPGAGKSTIVNEISKMLSAEENKVGIIAVDPTSPFTGGALLGDRIRMHDLPSDGSVYIRSMATRGSTGGLAGATNNVTIALDAFGFDFVLIETVGVGQVELDIINTCDAVVVVLVPESGDAIQALKAGLMEIADIFAVNKADRPLSESIVAELNNVLDNKREKSGWKLPVLPTEAVNNKNIDTLLDELKNFIQFSKETGLFEKHRRAQIKKKIFNIINYKLANIMETKIGGVENLDSLVNDIYAGKTDPFTASRKLLKLSDLD
ncbi:MAG TPA: methylmalonyl Co-A mutase-associated GTPase MeaB [candidate division Zixibacteria bacterium]|nr:methylmalonyl Co-A mutase-associated GTPase MeaB [candidate division Zixibacteria bacterium]